MYKFALREKVKIKATGKTGVITVITDCMIEYNQYRVNGEFYKESELTKTKENDDD